MNSVIFSCFSGPITFASKTFIRMPSLTRTNQSAPDKLDHLTNEIYFRSITRDSLLLDGMNCPNFLPEQRAKGKTNVYRKMNGFFSFVYFMVGLHDRDLSLPLDVIFALPACPLNDAIFCLHHWPML